MYLAFHLFAVLAMTFAIALFGDQGADAQQTAVGHASEPLRWPQLLHAWLGGVLGGTLYATKWQYHVVAKGLWSLDRRLWRFFTPHLSGSLALAFVVIMGSGLIEIIDRTAMSSIWVCFGISFLVGYFSDSATAKLSEVARTLFGTTKQPEPSGRGQVESSVGQRPVPQIRRNDG